MHPKLAAQVKKWYASVLKCYKDQEDKTDTDLTKAVVLSIQKQCQLLVDPKYAKTQIRPSMFGMAANAPHHPQD